MKHFFTFLLCLSSTPLLCMMITKNPTLLLQAFTQEKELFPIPHHITEMCTTLKNYRDDTDSIANSIILPIKESSEVIKGTLAYLELTHKLRYSKNPLIREKIFEYFTSKFISNEKTLISISNLIHFLDPQDQNESQISHIVQACKKGLISAAIKAQEKSCDNFIELNPDINPHNVSTFLEQSSLISDIMSKYINRIIPEKNKKYTHQLLNKNSAKNITDILYCTKNSITYAFKNVDNNNYITFATNNSHKKLKEVGTLLKKMIPFCTNDIGTFFAFSDHTIRENSFFLYNTDSNIIDQYSAHSARCISNENIYMGTSMGGVYVARNNDMEYICTSDNGSPIRQMTSSMYDSTLVCMTEKKDLFILEKSANSQTFDPPKKINMETIINIDSHSWNIKKMSLDPSGNWLYLIIKYSNGDSHDYLFNTKTNKIILLENIPHNYTLLDIQWGSSFIVRAYNANRYGDPLTHYVLSHISTGKSYTKNVNHPFICMMRNGFAHIQKQLINKETTYFFIPLIDQGLEQLAHFFDTVASFNMLLLIDKLIKNKEATCTDYDYYLYEKFPAPLKNILPIQQKI